MNTVKFLEKLGKLYVGDAEQEIYVNRICEYANMLDERNKKAGRTPDYEETYKFIAENYPYRAFPTFNHILECMKYKPKKIKPKVKMRGFRAETNLGIYDFWKYMKPEEEMPLFIRGFRVTEELPPYVEYEEGMETENEKEEENDEENEEEDEEEEKR